MCGVAIIVCYHGVSGLSIVGMVVFFDHINDDDNAGYHSAIKSAVDKKIAILEYNPSYI